MFNIYIMVGIIYVAYALCGDRKGLKETYEEWKGYKWGRYRFIFGLIIPCVIFEVITWPYWLIKVDIVERIKKRK